MADRKYWETEPGGSRVYMSENLFRSFNEKLLPLKKDEGTILIRWCMARFSEISNGMNKDVRELLAEPLELNFMANLIEDRLNRARRVTQSSSPRENPGSQSQIELEVTAKILKNILDEKELKETLRYHEYLEEGTEIGRPYKQAREMISTLESAFSGVTELIPQILSDLKRIKE